MVIKASGTAISKAFIVAELLKRKLKGMHQLNEIKQVRIQNKYEPLEKFLEMVLEEKKLNIVSITLNIHQLDQNHYGYQAPLPDNMVK